MTKVIDAPTLETLARKTSPSGRLTQKEAAAYIGISERWLRRARNPDKAVPCGPPFTQLSPRIIFYEVSDLEEWLRNRKVLSKVSEKERLPQTEPVAETKKQVVHGC